MADVAVVAEGKEGGREVSTENAAAEGSEGAGGGGGRGAGGGSECGGREGKAEGDVATLQNKSNPGAAPDSLSGADVARSVISSPQVDPRARARFLRLFRFHHWLSSQSQSLGESSVLTEQSSQPSRDPQSRLQLQQSALEAPHISPSDPRPLISSPTIYTSSPPPGVTVGNLSASASTPGAVSAVSSATPCASSYDASSGRDSLKELLNQGKMRRQDALDLLRMYHEAAAAPGPWENEPLPPELSVLGAESDRGDVVGVDSDDGSGGVLEQENAVENKEGKRDALVGTASRDESRDKEEEDKGGNAVREVKQEVNDEDGQEIADDWSDGALEEELQELQLVADLHYLLQQQQQHAGSENRASYDNGNELLVTVSETASVGGGYGKVGFQEPLRPAFYDAAEDGEGGYTEQFAQLRVHAAASVGRAASVASAATSARAGRVASAARTTSVARVGSGAASAARLRPVLPAAAEDGAGSTEQPVPLQNHSSSGAASAVTSSTAASASNAASAVSVRPVLPALYDAAEDGIGFTEQFAQMKLKAKGRREEEFSSIATAVTSSTAVTAATAATAATAVTAATASSASSAATAATSSTAATAFNAAGAVSMRPVLPALYDAADDGIGFTEQFAQMRVKVKGRRDEEF
ncbi:unnamed protein product [Closterium sp. NIES-65]|nr:unnamed protein product [Closterium sp. NIES-65]